MICIVIEDEIPAQRVLQNYISKLPSLDLAGSYQSALEANSILQNFSVDLVFLDINLPDISGIQYIKTIANPPCVIMTTAYPEHAVESFELDTICDYLVKPFSFERFLRAVNKVEKKLTPNSTLITESVENEETVFVNIDKTLHKIVIDTIIYIESDKNYVTIFTQKRKYCYLDSLKNWISRLPDGKFVQVHKSYIINHKMIDKINGNLLFIGENKIPVGRRYKPLLLKKLSL